MKELDGNQIEQVVDLIAEMLMSKNPKIDSFTIHREINTFIIHWMDDVYEEISNVK